MRKIMMMFLYITVSIQANEFCDIYMKNAISAYNKATAEYAYGSKRVAKMYALESLKTAYNAQTECSGSQQKSIKLIIEADQELINGAMKSIRK